MLRGRKKAVGWLCLLPLGILFLPTLIGHHPYDDRGVGSFGGFVSGRFGVLDEFVSMNFEGRSSSEWRWSRPSNYRYSELEFEWYSRGQSGDGSLDLSDMMLDTSSGPIAIDKKWFMQLPCDEELAEEFMAVLIAARDGSLPRPRHHNYYFEAPLDGRLSHWSLGFRLPYESFSWAVLWTLATLVFLARGIAQRRSEQDAACVTKGD